MEGILPLILVITISLLYIQPHLRLIFISFMSEAHPLQFYHFVASLKGACESGYLSPNYYTKRQNEGKERMSEMKPWTGYFTSIIIIIQRPDDELVSSHAFIPAF
jgi:hypothetical protein